MATCKKVAVLTHRNDKFESRSYFLALLLDCWKAAGVDVVVLRGTDQYVPADVLILHVDLTVTPEAYITFSRRYPLVINGSVLDISKRRISSHIIGQDDPYAGPVIVKTDLNCGGKQERRLENRTPFHQLAGKIMKRFTWAQSGNLTSSEYRIFPDSHSVPHRVWGNQRLVVEKFLPERDGAYYCTRHWLFFGDEGLNYRVFSHEPIVKAGNAIRSERGFPVPEPLRALRAQLGFDYGKFDYTMVNGEVILYDANRTPYISSKIVEKGRGIAEDLQGGLSAILASSAKSGN
jgi:hypothetical protein